MSKCHKNAKPILLIDLSARVQTFSKPGQSVEQLFKLLEVPNYKHFFGSNTFIVRLMHSIIQNLEVKIYVV